MALLGISGKKQAGKDEVAKIIQYLTSVHGKENTRTYEESKLKIDNEGYGYAGFGKYNSFFEIKKFADKLKDIVCLLIDCTREILENEKFKNTPLGEEWWYYSPIHENCGYIPYKDGYPPRDLGDFDLIKLTPRLLLQLLGTECGRKIIHSDIWVNATMATYECKLVYDKATVATLIESNWVISDVRFPNEVEAIIDKGGLNIRVERPSIKYSDQHESETALDDYDEWDYIIDNDGTIDELVKEVKEILIKENII